MTTPAPDSATIRIDVNDVGGADTPNGGHTRLTTPRPTADNDRSPSPGNHHCDVIVTSTGRHDNAEDVIEKPDERLQGTR